VTARFWKAASPLLAALAVIGLIVWFLPPRQQPAPAPPPPMVQESGPRIRYPADHTPSITLSDGRREPVRSLLNVTRPLYYGDYAWNEDGVAPSGPTWVRIDLARQTISVFRNGHEIGTAIVLYGTDGKPTPTGVFPILSKAERHRSTLYDADMPFMLRLTGDGVAVHASDVQRGRATHGCIGIPPAFAKLLYAQVKRGDLVAIDAG
jgi:lipoprotein-anchoring transpeptidase ErfK/SrfK